MEKKRGWWFKKAYASGENINGTIQYGAIIKEIYYGDKRITAVETLSSNPFSYKNDKLGIAIVEDRGTLNFISVNKNKSEKIEIGGGKVRVWEKEDKIVVAGWHAPNFAKSKIRVYYIYKNEEKIEKVFDVDQRKFYDGEYIGHYPTFMFITPFAYCPKTDEFLCGFVDPLNPCTPTQDKYAFPYVIVKPKKTYYIDKDKWIWIYNFEHIKDRNVPRKIWLNWYGSIEIAKKKFEFFIW